MWENFVEEHPYFKTSLVLGILTRMPFKRIFCWSSVSKNFFTGKLSRHRIFFPENFLVTQNFRWTVSTQYSLSKTFSSYFSGQRVSFWRLSLPKNFHIDDSVSLRTFLILFESIFKKNPKIVCCNMRSCSTVSFHFDRHLKMPVTYFCISTT